MDGLDELDALIVDGLSDYVDVRNIALKAQRDQGQFILGGKLKSTPENISQFEQGLSLGMTAMNEAGGDTLAADIPDTPINREMHKRLVQHFKGHTNHGLRSALAGMGLESKEKQGFTVRDREADAELLDRTARRAADRCMELIAGRQRTAGYPTTAIPIVGGHQIGRATSKAIGYPEQILYDNNMEVEGALEGQVRHEYRGGKASELAGRKLLEFLADPAVDSQTALKICDALGIIAQGDGNAASEYRMVRRR